MATTFVLLCGGPFGTEEAVPYAGPGLAIGTLVVMPFIWALPYVLLVSEMTSSIPVHGGTCKCSVPPSVHSGRSCSPCSVGSPGCWMPRFTLRSSPDTSRRCSSTARTIDQLGDMRNRDTHTGSTAVEPFITH